MTTAYLWYWLGPLLWILPGSVLLTKSGWTSPRDMADQLEEDERESARDARQSLAQLPTTWGQIVVVGTWMFILVAWPGLLAWAWVQKRKGKR